jgi:hypothetical protein
MFSARVHIGTTARYIKAGAVRKHCEWGMSAVAFAGQMFGTDHGEEPFQAAVAVTRASKDGDADAGGDEDGKGLDDVDDRLDLLQGRECLLHCAAGESGKRRVVDQCRWGWRE